MDVIHGNCESITAACLYQQCSSAFQEISLHNRAMAVERQAEAANFPHFYRRVHLVNDANVSKFMW